MVSERDLLTPGKAKPSRKETPSVYTWALNSAAEKRICIIIIKEALTTDLTKTVI